MECLSTTDRRSSSKPGNNGTEKKKKKGSKRNNNINGVKLSTDPQSVAARERRHRISDRFKILQSLVPGGNKMDTVSMLEEAINYVKFLKTQIALHQTIFDFADCYGLPINHPVSLTTPPQLPLCFDTNFAPEMQQPSSHSLPVSGFQCPEDACFDAFLDN